MEEPKKIWTAEEISAMMYADGWVGRAWVEHSIKAIYKYQTESEQSAKCTEYLNGVGFSGVHAKFGSSLAEWLQKGNHLTERQFISARKMMQHYCKQLARIANDKQRMV